jgi:hypothetical protein
VEDMSDVKRNVVYFLHLGLIGRILKINKRRIIKKNVKLLHLWTVVVDVKSYAFTFVKMLPQM